MSANRILVLLFAVFATAGMVALAGDTPSREANSVVDDLRTPAGMMSALEADTIQSPGLNVGITTTDKQHNQSQGHQVASDPGSSVVHFAWTWSDGEPHHWETNRRVRYNSYSKTFGEFNQGPNGLELWYGDDSESSMPRIDVGSENIAHMSFHMSEEIWGLYQTWHLHFPFEGAGLHLDYELPLPASMPWEEAMTWCDIAVGQRDTWSNDVWHVIAMGWWDADGYTPTDRIWYWRLDNAAVTPTWEGPALLESTGVISYTIDADDNSGKVAMVFTRGRYWDDYSPLNNVMYHESQTRGAGWIDGSELGADSRIPITSYFDTLGPQAWMETSVAYDHHSGLNIIYLEQRFANQTEQVALKHWSDARGSSRTVAEAYYDNNNHGWWDHLNLAFISLGIGDGATMCQGGIEDNEDYLYVLYTQLGGASPEEQADTSTLGFSNGELYLTGSNSGGDSWSISVNLTNTKSPNCTSSHPESTCASEAYATIARDVSDIEIMYIREYEAGPYTRAPWSLDRVKYLNFPGGTTDAEHLCPLYTCTCPCANDPNCDGVLNVIDVVLAVDAIFHNDFPTIDPNCPYRRVDVTCDGIINVIDVVKYVNVAFRNADPLVEFCDPCP